jgi:hypothetical protein
MQRYDLVTNFRCYQTIDEMERSEDGEWIRYEDLLDRLVELAPQYSDMQARDFGTAYSPEDWAQLLRRILE